MRRTYAYNSIIFGALLGIGAYAATESIALGIIACLAVSIVGFIIIRAIERAIDKGVDKAAEKIGEAHRRRKAEKAGVSAAPTTAMPTRFAPAYSGNQTNTSDERKTVFCPHCGSKISAECLFCPECGQRV